MRSMLNLLMRIAFLLVILAPRTAISQCVRRQQMLSRGQRWVDDSVAYSQTNTHEGYRTDCSGFVSMCWGLPKPGPSTRGFDGRYSINITKSELQSGDALLCPGRHILLFL